MRGRRVDRSGGGFWGQGTKIHRQNGSWLGREGHACLAPTVGTRAAGAGRGWVMVWPLGGAFHFGSASLPLYAGGALAARGDVVVVGVTHRLGVFGFLHLADVAGEPYTSSG